jgi:hypothetical protein
MQTSQELTTLLYIVVGIVSEDAVEIKIIQIPSSLSTTFFWYCG